MNYWLLKAIIADYIKKMELKSPSEFARMILSGFKNTCSSDVKICEKDFSLKEKD
mgnify:FL=1